MPLLSRFFSTLSKSIKANAAVLRRHLTLPSSPPKSPVKQAFVPSGILGIISLREAQLGALASRESLT